MVSRPKHFAWTFALLAACGADSSVTDDVDVVDDVVLEPSFEESVKDELVLKNIGARDLFSGSGDGDKKDCRSSSESESIF